MVCQFNILCAKAVKKEKHYLFTCFTIIVCFKKLLIIFILNSYFEHKFTTLQQYNHIVNQDHQKKFKPLRQKKKETKMMKIKEYTKNV